MHPLFPTEGDQATDDERDISWIQVTRWEGGAYKFAPQLVAAEDLQGLEELHQLFGGGQYELIARIADKSRISTRKKYNLPGPSKPLAPSTGDDPGASSTATAQAQGAAIVGSADSPMMALLAMMMQQSQQQAAMMTQVIVAALGARNVPPPDHTGPVVKALTEMATRAQATGQAPQGSMDAILRAMEIGRSLGKGEGEGDESSLMASLAQLLHGAMAAQQSGPPTNGAPPS